MLIQFILLYIHFTNQVWKYAYNALPKRWKIQYFLLFCLFDSTVHHEGRKKQWERSRGLKKTLDRDPRPDQGVMVTWYVPSPKWVTMRHLMCITLRETSHTHNINGMRCIYVGQSTLEDVCMPLSVWMREMYMLLSQLLHRQRPSITNARWAALLFSWSLKSFL